MTVIKQGLTYDNRTSGQVIKRMEAKNGFKNKKYEIGTEIEILFVVKVAEIKNRRI